MYLLNKLAGGDAQLAAGRKVMAEDDRIIAPPEQEPVGPMPEYADPVVPFHEEVEAEVGRASAPPGPTSSMPMRGLNPASKVKKSGPGVMLNRRGRVMQAPSGREVEEVGERATGGHGYIGPPIQTSLRESAPTFGRQQKREGVTWEEQYGPRMSQQTWPGAQSSYLWALERGVPGQNVPRFPGNVDGMANGEIWVGKDHNWMRRFRPTHHTTSIRGLGIEEEGMGLPAPQDVRRFDDEGEYTRWGEGGDFGYEEGDRLVDRDSLLQWGQGYDSRVVEGRPGGPSAAIAEGPRQVRFDHQGKDPSTRWIVKKARMWASGPAQGDIRPEEVMASYRPRVVDHQPYTGMPSAIGRAPGGGPPEGPGTGTGRPQTQVLDYATLRDRAVHGKPELAHREPVADARLQGIADVGQEHRAMEPEIGEERAKKGHPTRETIPEIGRTAPDRQHRPMPGSLKDTVGKKIRQPVSTDRLLEPVQVAQLQANPLDPRYRSGFLSLR